MNFQDIIQAGGIGVAVFSIWVLWKIVNNHEKHFVGIVRENNEALQKNALSHQHLTDAVNNLISLISQKFIK